MTKFSPYTLLTYITVSSLVLLLVYFPGLSGGFVFDDTSNILSPSGIRMHELSWDNILNAAFSMKNRPISRASFGLNFLAYGFDPFYFKVVNLIIHEINTVLVFIFVLLLLNQPRIKTLTHGCAYSTTLIAAAVSIGWALHPVNLTNVLYIVQRMNSLSAMFVLAGLICYIRGRQLLDYTPVSAWLYLISPVLLFLPLAWFSKENGALLLIYLFILELVIFQFKVMNKNQRASLYLFQVLFILLPMLLALIYVFQHAGMFQAGYENRHFSLVERLLTEPRVLWLYIQMILLPTPSLFGLFLDDIQISISFMEPISTAFALPALAGLIVVALSSIKRAPILAFGLLFFLTGHSLEASFIPLELAFEHRNYLPSVGLLLPLFYYLWHGFTHEKYIKTRLSTMAFIIFLFALQTHLRAWTWSDNSRLYLTEALHHPSSPRANYEAGKVFGQRLEQGVGDTEVNYRTALEYFTHVTALRNNTTSGLFGIILASIDGKQKIQTEWVDELDYRLGSKPLEQVNLRWLDRLTDCVSHEGCNEENLQIPRLITSAINNNHASTFNKAMLHAILAKYLFQVDRDLDRTLEVARVAVSLRPSNLYYRLNLVKYLISAGKTNEAKKVLKEATKVDIYNQHATEISRLTNILEYEN